MSTKVLRSARILAAALGVAVLVVACGSSKSSKGPTTTSSGSSATSGTPIRVGSLASLSNPAYSTPQNKAGMQAAIDAINAAGGVNGHALSLDFCDTNYDVNKELSCTRQLLGDHVSAVVNPAILADQTGREYTLAQAAHTAFIGGEGLTPAALTNPISFPLSGGLAGWFAGAAKVLAENGATKVSIITTSDPTSEAAAQLTKAYVAAQGMEFGQIVTANQQADPTLSAAVAKATTDGVNGLILTNAPLLIPKLLQAIKSSGYAGKTASITALFAPELIKASGSAANGVLLSSQLAFTTDTSNSGIVSFLADMKKYEPSAVIDESTEFSWAATELFAKVAATASSTDAAGILAAMNALSTPIDIGVAAPYAVVGKTSPVPGFTRILNPTGQFGAIQNGALVPDGKGFQDPFTKA